MPGPLTILTVDDDKADRLTVRKNLRDADLDVTIVEAVDLPSAVGRIGEGGVDCVILDYRLAGDDGLDLLRRVREDESARPEDAGLPMIVLTGRGDELVAVEAMKAGATDYIPKYELSPHRLASAIRTGVEIHKRRAEAAKAQAALRRANRELERRVRDRTADLERANEELRRRNVELDEFAYVASHDLQEPLRKLIAFSELLPDDVGGGLPERAVKDLGFICEAARRMQTLVRDLLALSRAGNAALSSERVRLDECADRAIEALSTVIEESGARIERDELPEVNGDRTMLTQLYQNLISNAVKFSRRGGAPCLRLTAQEREEGWILGVQDNGVGIKPEYAEQIFQPFKRLHGRDEYEGNGIGLTICRKTVERHGGRIWVEPNTGEGAHFRFTMNRIAENEPCPVETESVLSSC